MGVQIFEQRHGFPAPMPLFHAGHHMAVVQIKRGQNQRSVPLAAMVPGSPSDVRQAPAAEIHGAVFAMAWTPGFSSMETVITEARSAAGPASFFALALPDRP